MDRLAVIVLRGRHDRRRDRGAVLVEIGLTTPIFLALVFGVFELGLLFRDSLTTENASRQAARAASTKGRDPEADFFIIRSAENGLAAMDLQALQYIVVFKASGPGDDVPAACRTSSQTNVCNRYTPAEFFASMDDAAGNDTGNFRCGTLDAAWCPTTRETQASAGPDYIGVHVETTHRYLTGMFGADTSLGTTTVLQIEPDRP